MPGKHRPFIFIPDMGQVLRLTHNGKDHGFEILNTEPLSADTREIAILLEGKTYTLSREGNSWLPKEGTPEVYAGIVSAIGKTIGLRYRI